MFEQAFKNIDDVLWKTGGAGGVEEVVVASGVFGGVVR
jgi:hypothetical protein